MRLIYRGVTYESTHTLSDRPGCGMTHPHQPASVQPVPPEAVQIPQASLRLSYRGNPYIRFR
ncbi:DUF4278 domain-containing protein (plasmid) [Kovacikia minuta CCNUW1]|uniref:DUF4278 domain-containing protein n=1 Tax=Kovacikia minuta TaxID=2931930 RepID=UPI001CCE2468|nr:DUF4278 domain-containing protein [Kovacikia minuta]UBF29799.1 DUF4278 domain-containing protein [Kovacikia minuta CCNUW1]